MYLGSKSQLARVAWFFLHLLWCNHARADTSSTSAVVPTKVVKSGPSIAVSDCGGACTAPLEEVIGAGGVRSTPHSPSMDGLQRTIAETHGPLRKLPDVISGATWQFPAGTTLSALSPLTSEVFGSGAPTGTSLVLMAGYKYAGLAITSPSNWNYESLLNLNGVLGLRGNINTPSECTGTTNYVSMALTADGPGVRSMVPSVLASGRTLAVNSALNVLSAPAAYPHVVFMEGGRYRLCYSPSGPVASNLVPVPIVVFGVVSGCQGDGCLSAERWDCYFNYRAELEVPCVVDFTDFGERASDGWSVRAAAVSRLWWSAAWDKDKYITLPVGIRYQPGSPLECSDTLKVDGAIVPERFRYNLAALPDDANGAGLVADASTPARLPGLTSVNSTDAFTLTLCYCPNFDAQGSGQACDHASEFIQPVGRLHYWTLRICDMQNYLYCGTIGQPYMRVLPQQPFVLRLQCPAGGRCAQAGDNSLKFIQHIPDAEEYPLWDPYHRCRLFPLEPEVAQVKWLLDAGETLGNQVLSGGTRGDYKVWSSRPLMANLSLGQSFDVCYCDAACDDRFTNYFKVGVISTAAAIGIARWTQDLALATAANDPIETIQFVGKPGAMTLYAGVTSPLTEGMRPYDSTPFSRPALMKLLSYDRELLDWAAFLGLSHGRAEASQEQTLERAASGAQALLDRACAVGPYSAELVEGPSSSDAAQGWKAYAPVLSKYLPFSGRQNDQSFIVRKAGTVVVCYCALLDSSSRCAFDNSWVHATRIMVKGPKDGASLTFPTNFPVQIELEGWGFNFSDSLRLLGTTQICAENGFSPRTITAGYRIGCPGLDGTDCRRPSQSEDIGIMLTSADASAMYIVQIVVGENETTLTFTGDITAVLLEGDAITLDDNSLLLNSQAKPTWTAAQRYDVAKLSGIYEFADDPLASRILWNRVSYVTRAGKLIQNQLTLPVGWPETGRPAFAPSTESPGVSWTQRNRLRTKQMLQASDPITMRVCWAARDGNQQKYYADAGEVSFISPNVMYDAAVYLTGQLSGAIVPVVIAFTPDRAQLAYQALPIPITLRLNFRDAARLEPLLAGALTEHLLPLSSAEAVPKANATQTLCGKLFSEMWTNDVGGFPLPQGCYFGPQHQDKPSILEDGSLETVALYREYFIVFETKAGLKAQCVDFRTGELAACVYMLVLNARIGHINDVTREVVGLYTLCNGPAQLCNSYTGPPPVIEYGEGLPHKTSLPAAQHVAELGRLEMAPLGILKDYDLPADRLELLPSRLEEGTLRPLLDFDIRAWPRDPCTPIQRGATLRIWFQPFGAWDLGFLTDCDAVCYPAPGLSCSDGRGGNKSTCSLLEVTSGRIATLQQMPKNVLVLQYPQAMESVPCNRSNESHLLVVTNLALPMQGFFPVQFLAQLTDELDVAPSLGLVRPSMFRLPVAGTTSGWILVEGQAGCGPLPFVSQNFNTLVLRLTLGVTLRNAVMPTSISDYVDAANNSQQENQTNDTIATTQTYAPLAVVDVLLPEGYQCFVVAGGAAQTQGAQELFTEDENGDGYFDHFNQTLSNGRWSSSLRRCTFTLEAAAQIYAGQVFYVQLVVTNPSRPLLRDDPDNVWLLAPGGSAGLVPAVPFLSLAEEALHPGWVGNVAVLTALAGESLQPTILHAGADNYLHVFFTAVHSMVSSSYVVLDAPDDFDFGAVCEVSDLDKDYYADWQGLPWGEGFTGPLSQTNTLGSSPNCIGDNWKRLVRTAPATSNFTRARIRVLRTLLSGRAYGFKLRVRNTRNYSVLQHDMWRMWIQSPRAYPVDGSFQTMLFNGLPNQEGLPASFFDRSWGTYLRPLSSSTLQANFSASAVLPTTSAGMPSVLTMFPLAVNLDGGVVHVRLTAPAGYEFDISGLDGFMGMVPGQTCIPECVLVTVPLLAKNNELVLRNLVLRVGKQYGFQVRVRIPSRPPTRSTNAFFLELGYQSNTTAWSVQNSGRMQAGMLLAPALRVIRAARVYSLSNAAAASPNLIDFYLTTTSALGRDDGFVFKGDTYTRWTVLACSPSAIPGALPLPMDLSCIVFTSLDGFPVVALSVTGTNLPGGPYGFRFATAANPSSPQSKPGSWQLGTYRNMHAYPMLHVLDESIQVPSDWVREEMRDAQLLSPYDWEAFAMGRDDRPGMLNNLTFVFALRRRPLISPAQTELVLALRGPSGFEFLENCSDSLQVLGSTVRDAVLGQLSASSESVTNATIGVTWPCSARLLPTQAWCPGAIEGWPPKLRPVACLGLGSSARISVPILASLAEEPLGCSALGPENCKYGGFEAATTYGFQIVAKNPVDNKTTSEWALDFGSEASVPIPSFRVRTFSVDATVLRATSGVRAALLDDVSDSIALKPISLYFTPLTEVPAPLPSKAPRRLQGATGLPLASEAVQGLLQLQAPLGFVFSCSQLLLEKAGRQVADAAALFSVGPDLSCSGQNNVLSLELVGSKALKAEIAYRLVAFLLNPTTVQGAGTWQLASYKRRVATGQVRPLDLISLLGFPVTQRMPAFVVENLSNEPMGGAKVRTVRVTMRFGTPLYNGDTVCVFAPTGFDLRGTRTADGPQWPCAGFRWKDGALPLPSSPPPNCTWEAGLDGRPRGVLRMGIDERELRSAGIRTLVWDKGLDFAFEVSAVNPLSTPDPVQNYWSAAHTGGNVTIEEQSAVSWRIYAQITNITFTIAGSKQRATAISDLAMALTAATWGRLLEVTVQEPTGFDFASCRPDPPLVLDARSNQSRLVLANGNFAAGVPTRFLISQVQLGKNGGQTRVDFRLYNSEAMDASSLVAQRLNYLLGFRLAGSASVLRQYFWSTAAVAHFEAGQSDPVLPALPPPAGQPARMELLFDVSVDVLGGSLVVRSVSPDTRFVTPCSPQLDAPAFFPTLALCNSSTVGRPPSQTGDSGTSTCATKGFVNVTDVALLRNELNLADGLRVTLVTSLATPVLRAGQVYRFRAWCVGTISTTNWLVNTEDGGPRPSNTNDARDQALPAAAPMELLVVPFTARSPPGSLVRATVRVRARADQPTAAQLQVILPSGFTLFDRTAPAVVPSGGRSIVGVDASFGVGDIMAASGKVFELQVITPSATPSDTRWFVMALSPSLQTLGWGQDPGFAITPLPVRLAYAPIPSFTGWLAASFTIPLIRQGQYILVSAPPGFQVICPGPAVGKSDGLCNEFSTAPAAVRSFGPLERTVNVSLAVSGVLEGANVVYSVLLGVTTPAYVQGGLNWDVRIIDASANVVDSSIGVRAPTSGAAWRSDLYVESPTLSWESPPQAGESSVVTVEVTFERRAQAIRALLIFLPENYRHDIQNKNQLKCINRDFPVAIDVDWQVFWNVRWVRILVAQPASQAVDFIPAGTYQFKFPIMVPMTLPASTEFYLALCFDQSCSDPDGDGVFVSFPIPNSDPVLPRKVFGAGLIATTAGVLGRLSHEIWKVVLVIMALQLEAAIAP